MASNLNLSIFPKCSFLSSSSNGEVCLTLAKLIKFKYSLSEEKIPFQLFVS